MQTTLERIKDIKRKVQAAELMLRDAENIIMRFHTCTRENEEIADTKMLVVVVELLEHATKTSIILETLERSLKQDEEYRNTNTSTRPNKED
jgi:hypothetical protein